MRAPAAGEGVDDGQAEAGAGHGAAAARAAAVEAVEDALGLLGVDPVAAVEDGDEGPAGVVAPLDPDRRVGRV
jgi:hypothetical protein